MDEQTRREFLKKLGIVVGSMVVTAKLLPPVVDKEKGTFDVPMKVTILGIKDKKTGKIHPLKLFDRVLTDEEIEKLFDMTLREIADL
jgi:hypothetical protein